MALWGATLAAAPVLTVTSNGASTLSVSPGATLELDVDLSGLGTEVAVSASFEVTFSVQGLRYDSYLWTVPFTTGAGDDLSLPPLSALPAIVTDNLFGAVGSPIDVHFDNFASSGGAGNGTLTTLTMQVPTSFPSPSTVTITVAPGEFVFDNSPFAVTPAVGAPFILDVAGVTLDVTVDLEGVDRPTTRNVTFVLTDCVGNVAETFVVAVNLDINGVGSTTLSLTDPNMASISADEDHTLRRLLPLSSPLPASVSFTAANRLLAGDFTGDNLVDVEDLSALAFNWNTPGALADINGDGIQDTIDFTAILVNFFQLGQAVDACGP